MTELEALRLILTACVMIPLVVSLAVTPLSMRIAGRIGAIDVPKDKRRMHDRPVPCLGGLAILVAIFVTLILIRFDFFQTAFHFDGYESISDSRIGGLMTGGAIIFICGVIDDVRGMRPLVKLACQIGAASCAYAFGVRMSAIKLIGLNLGADSAEGLVLSYIITVIWIVAITNMINLIDGMDGLAAGVAAISSLAIAYSGYLHGYYDISLGMCAVAGSALGFLPFNFYPARSFMGDSGAMFLGFMMAAVSSMSLAKGATIVAIIVPVIVLGVPIFDVFFAVFRRILHRQSIFAADKDHVHHQLANIGMGQRRTVVMLYGITSVMGIAAILISRGGLLLEAIFLFCIALLFIFVLIWKWNVRK